jgi:subtilisin family serine protease
MKKNYLFLFLIAFTVNHQVSLAKHNANVPQNKYVLPQGAAQEHYLAKTIVFKVNEQFRSLCLQTKISDAEILVQLNALGIVELKKMFPHATVPEKKFNEQGQALADLTLIYQVVYSNNIGIEEAANKLLSTRKLQYAEPKFINSLHLAVNDPLTNQQSFLTKINAYNGWNTSIGDTNVVIGIVDSGTDIDHPDLVGNIKINYADPVNGIDDDGDGYTDNFQGWDMSENDNNPNVDNSTHGSHVSGCAAASTDNAVGVASPGFKCKFLPVKCAAQASTTSIDNGYEGITYAADHGCQIINCSWGGGFFNQLGQDVITYATINKNALVLASAGNDNIDSPAYPAAFQYVTSVAATNASDTKASFSNYNFTVDISAPGNNIYSTVSTNNGYTTMSGTSMSSPVAAGAAGVIKSHFPSYNALQVGEQLRVTCDDIYGLATNNNYKGRLGKGRINMGNALTQALPSVRMEPINFTDANDDAFVAGDTIRISGDFMNYLAPTNNCTVILTAQTNPTYVNIIGANYSIGALNTLATTNNNAAPFRVVVNPAAPPNAKVLFRLTYLDGTTYTDFQTFELIINVDYINVTINDVYTTITSKGRSCYNGDGQTQGLGFVYRDSSLAYECGLMIGTSTTKVVNTVRNTTATPDNDFASMVRVGIDNPTVISDFDLSGKFNDNNAVASAKLNIEVKHRSFTWNAPGDMNYVMVQYNIKNTSTSTLNNLYAAIFTDWDIQNYSQNRSDQNPALKLGYSYATSSTQLYAGVKVLSNTPFNMYAADNITGGGGGINLADGYDTSEKYQTMSTTRTQAGTAGAGNDVINIVSTGPFTIPVGDSVIVAFALIGGEDLNELETGAANAQIRYDAAFPTITTVNLLNNQAASLQVVPNPANDNVSVLFNLIETAQVQIGVYDIEGKLVKEITNTKNVVGLNKIQVSLSELPAGIYNCKLITKDNVLNSKFSLIK